LISAWLSQAPLAFNEILAFCLKAGGGYCENGIYFMFFVHEADAKFLEVVAKIFRVVSNKLLDI
jgi:hypothetical protein